MAYMDATSSEAGARPKKWKRVPTKSAGKQKSQPPASSTESLLELERLKNQNLKIGIKIVKAQLELERVKSTVELKRTSRQPHLLQARMTSTPANTTARAIPTLEQLWDKKKTGSTLPNNFVFLSEGTLTCESLGLYYCIMQRHLFIQY